MATIEKKLHNLCYGLHDNLNTLAKLSIALETGKHGNVTIDKASVQKDIDTKKEEVKKQVQDLLAFL